MDEQALASSGKRVHKNSATGTSKILIWTSDDLKTKLANIKKKRKRRNKISENFRGKQPRTFFQGGHVSPWCAELLGHSAGMKTVNLLRTVPVENCMSGGRNTYHPVGMDDVGPFIQKMQNTVKNNRLTYANDIREGRAELLSELHRLDGMTIRFCTERGLRLQRHFVLICESESESKN